MADSLMTLADLAKINSRDLYTEGTFSDLLQSAPLLQRMPAAIAPLGDTFKYYVESANSVAVFRAANAGKDFTTSTDTEVSVSLKYVDASVKQDVATANAYIYGPEALIAMKAGRALANAFFVIEKQILQGTNADADGFNGLPNNAGLSDVADSQVIDAGGTTALTSVYALRMGPSDCQVLVGNNGIISIGETRQELTIDSSSKSFSAYVTPIDAWAGVTMGDKYSCGRIANVDSGSNKLTDAKIAELLEQFPGGAWPDVLVMNSRSAYQLQSSRTATNATGSPAPWPAESQGIPIIVSPGLGNAETQVT
tara:strand:- start:264 stop:1193 length:930 start_codon:yes stop_codon:yes gene_type:complete